MSVRRSLIVLSLVTAIAPVAAFSSRTTQMQAANPTQNLRVHTIGRGDVIVTISAVGEIEADETANLSFNTQGRVTEKLVDIGDFVHTGDQLVRLEATAYDLAYQQAELAVQAAELDMQDL